MSQLWPSGAGLAGIGADIIEIERIRRAAERSNCRFLERVFTTAERDYCDAKRDRYACYAARFAAKEAVLKAMGRGLSGCRWSDVEIRRADEGRPEVHLHGKAAEMAKERGIGQVLVSLSHDKRRALAFAVAVREEA